MMNRHQNNSIGQRPQRTLNKIAITIAIVAFSWLSVCSKASHAQQLHRYLPRVKVGSVAEKPEPPPPANAPKIMSLTNTAHGSVTIRFHDFAAIASRKQFVLERQTIGSSTWITVYSKTVLVYDLRYDPHAYDHRPQPGGEFRYRDTKDLVYGKKYRYRVREIVSHKSQKIALLSAVRTISINPVGSPTPPIPTPTGPTPPNPTPPEPNPTDPKQPVVVTKTVCLKVR